MKKRIISTVILLVILLTVATVFTACGPGVPTKADLVGKWEGEFRKNKVTFEFKEDGKFTKKSGTSETSGEYSVEENQMLKLKYSDGSESSETFLLHGDEFTFMSCFVGGDTSNLVGEWKSTSFVKYGKELERKMTVKLNSDETGEFISSVSQGGNTTTDTIKIKHWEYNGKDLVNAKIEFTTPSGEKIEEDQEVFVHVIGNGICIAEKTGGTTSADDLPIYKRVE